MSFQIKTNIATTRTELIKERKISPITHFSQNTSYYCGPACSQMFLSHFSIEDWQVRAYDRIRMLNQEPDNWYSDPSGLSNYISEKVPNELLEQYGILIADSFDDALNNIIYNILYREIPGITLINRGAHWIVIDGIRFTENQNGERKITAISYLDPSPKSPKTGYIFASRLRSEVLTPNVYGKLWKGKIVMLSVPRSGSVLSLTTDDRLLLGGGGGGPPDVESLTIELMKRQGFNNLVKTGSRGGGTPVLKPIEVEDIDRGERYTIVPLDGTTTEGFSGYVYIAIKEGDVPTVLEAVSLSDFLDIPNDQEAYVYLRTLYPTNNIEIVKGYFWKSSLELKSLLSVARKFVLDGKEMLLLPDGTVISSLTEPTIGGS